jgi:hypothetical protein
MRWHHTYPCKQTKWLSLLFPHHARHEFCDFLSPQIPHGREGTDFKLFKSLRSHTVSLHRKLSVLESMADALILCPKSFILLDYEI